MQEEFNIEWGHTPSRDHFNIKGPERNPYVMSSLKQGGSQSMNNVFKVIKEWWLEWINFNLDACLQSSSSTTTTWISFTEQIQSCFRSQGRSRSHSEDGCSPVASLAWLSQGIHWNSVLDSYTPTLTFIKHFQSWQDQKLSILSNLIITPKHPWLRLRKLKVIKHLLD